MRLLNKSFYILFILFSLSTLSYSKDNDSNVLDYLNNIKLNSKIRIITTELGAISGRLNSFSNDTLLLDVDKSTGSNKLSRRRARRRRPVYSKRPHFIPVENPKYVPIFSIKEIQKKTRMTKTGAIVGSIIGAGMGFAVSIIAAQDNYNTSDGEQLKFMALGIFTFGSAGALLGTAVSKWSLHYREPGFEGNIKSINYSSSLSIKPILTLSYDQYKQPNVSGMNLLNINAGIKFAW